MTACELTKVDARNTMLHAHVVLYVDSMDHRPVPRTVLKSKQCSYCICATLDSVIGRK